MRAVTAVRRRLTFSNVMATVAVGLVLTTGTAYAAATITSADIVNGTIAPVDMKPNSIGTNIIKDNGVKSVDIRDSEVTSIDILDGTVSSADILNETITAADLATNSVGAPEIATDAVGATEIADNTIDSGEVVDFGLTNQDVGVLFAQVNADGTIANHSGGVTGFRIGTGTYEVDFGRNISSCAFTATQGEAAVGGAVGAIMGVTDRSGNAEAVFVTVRTDANAPADRAFQLVVVC